MVPSKDQVKKMKAICTAGLEINRRDAFDQVPREGFNSMNFLAHGWLSGTIDTSNLSSISSEITYFIPL